MQIPRDCEDLAQRVAEPQWRKGDNPKALLARSAVALKHSNRRLNATRTCQERQRKTFAGEGP